MKKQNVRLWLVWLLCIGLGCMQLPLPAKPTASAPLIAAATSTPMPLSTSPLSQEPTADNPSPPSTPVKLIFIHHSTGGAWLADDYGGLALALMANNYYVSATNYGWGPNSIGDRTDIPNWPEWFIGPQRDTIMAAVYTESGKNEGDFGTWTRMATDPGGPNQIIMFKSCFPNSHLEGNPNDPPLPAPNDELSVANAKAVYNAILSYFAAHPEKLFIVITAPPLMSSETDASHAANARAFNNWLVNNWLSENNYTYPNVAVFDYYNVLTSNGGNPNTNDAGAETGNHHRWRNNAVQHQQTVAQNTSAYPTYDSHPTAAGQQKATAEFVPLLNVYYNRWKSASTTPTLNLTSPQGGEVWLTNTPYMIRWTTTGSVPQVNLAYSTDNFVTRHEIASNLPNTNSYTWTTPAIPSEAVRVRVESSAQPNSVYAQSDPFRLSTEVALNKHLFLPVSLRNYNPGSGTTDRLQPSHFTYLGAFRLPGGDERPATFAYGGNAMTYNPDHNTLFITGHDRMPYGELPNGGQIAEVSIPTPSLSRNVDELPQAEFVQTFQDALAGRFSVFEEIPRIGMVYINTSATGPVLHVTYGQHFEPDPPAPTQGWIAPTLNAPNFQGAWFIGGFSFYSVGDYMLEIPSAWAAQHIQGRVVGTGRSRDGGWSGMGPTLLAYRPWNDAGTPPAPNSTLNATALLRYATSLETANIERALQGYQYPDEWNGGAWITTASGRTALLFAGTKSNGTKYWYGYANPAGPDIPCVDEEVTDFVTCRQANGTPCPAEDFHECNGHNDYRGWWSTHFDAQFLLYDPQDLARVASGAMASWEPQPYAVMDIDDRLFLNPSGVETDMLGTGNQRRYRLGDVAFDRVHGRLYVLEVFADGAKPVVHVWQVP